MEAGHTPGLGIALVHGGEIVWERGFGHADTTAGTAMTEHTPVVIGSTTKAMTAAAMLQLAEQGRLNLDDPISRYVPFRLVDQDMAARITIRQALTHTAGLPPTPVDGPAFLYSDEGDVDRYIDELSAAESVWAPGGGWLYANDGYVLAGRVIEVVSGDLYEDYMDAHLFKPLALSETSFLKGVKPDPNVATPYDYGADGQPFSSFFPHNRTANAAGMLLMSAHDAARWLLALLGKGVLDEQRILSEASVAELLRPHAKLPPVAAARAESGWYALGWTVGTLNGIRTVNHGGSAITMGSQFIMVPEAGLGVAVVANSVSEVIGIVCEGAMSLMCGRKPARRFPRIDPRIEPDRSLWPRLAGTYLPTAPQNAVTSLLPIEIDGPVLRARTFPGDESRRPGDIFLAPLGDTSFVLYGRGKTGGTAQFEIDGPTVRATFQGAPLVKVASRLHSGSVVRWTPGE
jgi:CubicO group peptidase (beta-lactamase class C family)